MDSGWLDLAWFIIWALITLLGSAIVAAAVTVIFMVLAFNRESAQMHKTHRQRRNS